MIAVLVGSGLKFRGARQMEFRHVVRLEGKSTEMVSLKSAACLVPFVHRSQDFSLSMSVQQANMG
jgi:hypothetical protein